MARSKSSEAVRGELIEAAGRLFADRGFHAIGVREIVEAAGTHLSAVNYHFRDKAGLYAACVEAAMAMPRFDRIPESDLRAKKPRAMLRTMIEAIVRDMRDSEKSWSWKTRLMVRLLSDPDPSGEARSAAADWFERLAKPKFDVLRAVVAAAAPEGTEPARIELVVLAIIGQLEQISQAADLLPRAAPALALAMREEGWLAETIVRSTLATLKAKPTPQRHSAAPAASTDGDRPRQRGPRVRRGA